MPKITKLTNQTGDLGQVNFFARVRNVKSDLSSRNKMMAYVDSAGDQVLLIDPLEATIATSRTAPDAITISWPSAGNPTAAAVVADFHNSVTDSIEGYVSFTGETADCSSNSPVFEDRTGIILDPASVPKLTITTQTVIICEANYAKLELGGSALVIATPLVSWNYSFRMDKLRNMLDTKVNLGLIVG